ncbi:unnamed protein product [Protopolystoma xenopodis]|uniref:Uncharacterized protein n=1 Tax=Protopolystoma xenopodis TaxID=117903 RepID=A0A448WYP1_9PLAT|nr:unnamed protein product [Protopolystoma xenopodis]
MPLHHKERVTSPASVAAKISTPTVAVPSVAGVGPAQANYLQARESVMRARQLLLDVHWGQLSQRIRRDADTCHRRFFDICRRRLDVSIYIVRNFHSVGISLFSLLSELSHRSIFKAKKIIYIYIVNFTLFLTREKFQPFLLIFAFLERYLPSPHFTRESQIFLTLNLRFKKIFFQ